MVLIPGPASDVVCATTFLGAVNSGVYDVYGAHVVGASVISWILFSSRLVLGLLPPMNSDFVEDYPWVDVAAVRSQ